MNRAGRGAGQLGDFLERQSAPKPCDHRFALFDGQLSPSPGRLRRHRAGRRRETWNQAFVLPGDGRFAPGATLRRYAGVDRPVSHHPIQPAHRVFGHRRLAHEGQKRLLRNVLGRIAPLLGVKHQRRPVRVQEPTSRFPVRFCPCSAFRFRGPKYRHREREGFPTFFHYTHTHSQAPPGNALPRRLCLPVSQDNRQILSTL